LEGPLISKPDDVPKIFSSVEKQLASVRAAAEANTKVHQQAVDALRESHKEELKEVFKYTDDTIQSVREDHRKEIDEMKKAHEEELAKVRSNYKAAMSSLGKACLDGISTLEDARRKVDKACRDGAEKAYPEKTK
jgi:GTP1/Obg family GTP-binding protein